MDNITAALFRNEHVIEEHTFCIAVCTMVSSTNHWAG